MTPVPLPNARTLSKTIVAAPIIDSALVLLGLILTPTTIGTQGHGLPGNLPTFIMQDYLGGVFFHLLLGLIVAAILGTLGALAAKLVTRLLSLRAR